MPHEANGQNGSPRGRAGADEESQSLLRRDSQAVTTSSRFSAYMKQEVDTRWGDVILLLCYVITGLLDSSAVAIWGAFVSMQTGNTVYFGLGIADPKSSDRWIKSLVSISFFCLGSFCFARFHRYFSPRARWVLVASFTAQMLIVVAAATIITIDTHDEDPLHVVADSGVPPASTVFASPRLQQ